MAPLGAAAALIMIGGMLAKSARAARRVGRGCAKHRGAQSRSGVCGECLTIGCLKTWPNLVLACGLRRGAYPCTIQDSRALCKVRRSVPIAARAEIAMVRDLSACRAKARRARASAGSCKDTGSGSSRMRSL